MQEAIDQLTKKTRQQEEALQFQQQQQFMSQQQQHLSSAGKDIKRIEFHPLPEAYAGGWDPMRRQIPNPETYDGEPESDYRGWRLSLRQVAHTDRGSFADVQALISWAFNTTKGRARSLLQSYIEEIHEKERMEPGLWGEFLDYCDQQFGDEQAQARKRAEFRRLRQREIPFATFYADWIRLLREAGYNDMPEHAKIDWLNEAISPILWERSRGATFGVPTLKEQVRIIGGLADQYEARLVRPYGNNFQQRKNDWKNGKENSHQYLKSKGSNWGASNESMNIDSMDWEPAKAIAKGRRALWVNETERDRRRKAGLCLRCGGRGHMIADCPALPARSPKKVNRGEREDEEINIPEEGLEPMGEEGKA
jgi:hypothetical protein